MVKRNRYGLVVVDGVWCVELLSGWEVGEYWSLLGWIPLLF